MADRMPPFVQRMTRLVRGLFLRGEVSKVDDTGNMQTLQAKVLAGELDEDIEHMQPYGLTSYPKSGAEVVLARVGADSDHVIAIVVGDRRYRLSGLAEGEVAIYDENGHYVILKSDRIVIEAPRIDLGVNATAKVARKDDPVFSNATTDPTFWAWIADMNTKYPPTSAPVPTSLTGIVNDGSNTVYAED